MIIKFTNATLIVLIALCSSLYGQSLPQIAGGKVSNDTVALKIISKGGDAGDYQAFPDATRLRNGEIIAVFYAGDGHVTRASTKYPKAGRICIVMSKDDGHTWSLPRVLYDDSLDNRDAHVVQLKNGLIICTFFNLYIDSAGKHGEVRMITSKDDGKTWDRSSQLIAANWFCSAQVRELADGSLLLPVYTIVNHKTNSTRIGFVRSADKGKTWSTVRRAGQGSEFTVNETDVIVRKNGTLYAAVRGNFKEQIPMQYTESADMGKTWSSLKSIGFYADAPSFTRLKTGEILLSCRGYLSKEKTGPAYTALQISNNDGKMWTGPYLVDKSPGGYPSTVELADRSILIIFYQEGDGSGVGAIRFEKPAVLNNQRFAEPQPLKRLHL
jgi:sialidase-1